MEKILTLLMVSLFLLGAVGCQAGSGKSPATVVSDFYHLLEKGEVNKAYELLADSAKRGGPGALASVSDEIKKHEGIKDIKIIKEEILGETAHVTVKIYYGHGWPPPHNEAGTDEFVLLKEKGNWRLVSKEQ